MRVNHAWFHVPLCDRNVEPSRRLPQGTRAFEDERVLCSGDEILLNVYQLEDLMADPT